MFEVGQKVVCVRQHVNHILSVGKTYTIYGIRECSCGMVSLDVGISLSPNQAGVKCRGCGNEYITDIWYIGADKFRPLTYGFISNKDIITEEILETLDVPIKKEVEILA